MIEKPYTILIIDDSPDDRESYIRLLNKNSKALAYLEAEDGAAGLKLIEDYPVDCVLLDYSLPGMNGLMVLEQVREAYRFLPILLLTGQGNEAIAVESMKRGSQDYISKKLLTANALERAIKRAIEHMGMLEQVESYRQDLERSNHDLERFANIVAHDLKAPLRAVKQHLTILAERCSSLLDDKSKQSLQFSVEGADRMRVLIEALFKYAQIGFTEPSFSNVDMELILAQVKQDLSTVIEDRGVQITHDHLPEMRGDAVMLGQLFQNLLENAIKYCNDTPHIHIALQKIDDGWKISIEDNGIGIDHSQQDHVFDIFRRLHDNSTYPGIGLGLAICDRIVKQHGGMIGLHSTPDKGSTFYFTIPASLQHSQSVRRVAHG